ncbi:hypothetical protein IIB50_01525 [Patescibacteria group bacterium]|nr:hypothetical protein [Patescibacteria group bacterium]
MNNKRTTRIALNTALVSSILFLPWWFSVAVVVALLLAFSAYEVLAWGLFADMLYSAPIGAFAGIELAFTILFLLLFVCVGYSKQWLMFNND